VRASSEIHIPAGRAVDVDLVTADVIHSFWVPRLHGKVDLNPGMVTRIRVEADAPGVFSGQCSEYCGPQHAHMALLVVAQEPRDFDEWLDRLRGSEPDPIDASAQHGQHVFMTHECVLCHTIRGTPAQGLVGPDLTHFADRLGLASNSWPNDRGPLSAWVTDAQALKPHAQMPTITALSGPERQALVQYLQSLK
jgi:cytochrome c oxidase subunit 2